MATADLDLTSYPYAADPSAPDPNPLHADPEPAPDALDDLFNYDPRTEDTSNNSTNHSNRANASGNNSGQSGKDPLGLGIDEEIKIRKPRAPTAKLDEGRLLSQNGIPKLRRISKDRLRFRGKGHEFSDVTRLLKIYQLWLDDLFPKAKFADGLAIIEKLGHSKRMQTMRKEWIEEEKPKPRAGEHSDGDEEFVDHGVGANGERRGRGSIGAEREVEQGEAQVEAMSGNHEDRDRQRKEQREEESLFVEPSPPRESTHGEPREGRGGAGNDTGEPDEDELDSLLAEDAASRRNDQPGEQHETTHDDGFADAFDAMGDDW